MIGVLMVSHGGVAFFCYAAGFAALAGTLLGIRALPLWLADTGLGLAVAVPLLRSSGAAGGTVLAPFVVAFPMTDIVCGLGSAVLAGALVRYVDLSIEAIAAVQRSTAASERARLARELHDSVAKTLRGVSFAALALPSSLRRHPDLAERLAATVSEGADAAVREARELLGALRRDLPDRPFADNIGDVCRLWSATTGIPVTVTAAPIEPQLAARYELTQILHEALRNVARHAHAHQVRVVLGQSADRLELRIEDDGTGFPVPRNLSTLSASGSFGILGMSERAKAAGGTLDVASSIHAGTTLVVRLPRRAATGTATGSPRHASAR
jgi:signal transduction histidine kinase